MLDKVGQLLSCGLTKGRNFGRTLGEFEGFLLVTWVAARMGGEAWMWSVMLNNWRKKMAGRSERPRDEGPSVNGWWKMLEAILPQVNG